MSLTVQPGPPGGVARAKPVGLCKPVEGSEWIAEIHRREADLLVGPRLTGILGDHCFCGSDALFELALRPAERSACLQRDKVAWLGRQRARKQLLGLEQPLLVSRSVISVEHFEYERSRDAGQSVDVLRLDLQRLLIEIAGADHRLPRRWSIGDHLGTHEKVGGVGALWPLAFGSQAFDVDHFQADGSCQAADDFVLDLQDVVTLDIESFCPELCSSLRVDELCVDAESRYFESWPAQCRRLERSSSRKWRQSAHPNDNVVSGDDGTDVTSRICIFLGP